MRCITHQLQKLGCIVVSHLIFSLPSTIFIFLPPSQPPCRQFCLATCFHSLLLCRPAFASPSTASAPITASCHPTGSWLPRCMLAGVEEGGCPPLAQLQGHSFQRQICLSQSKQQQEFDCGDISDCQALTNCTYQFSFEMRRRGGGG